MKKFDVTLRRMRGIEVEAASEEEALKKAEELKDSDEFVCFAEEINKK